MPSPDDYPDERERAFYQLYRDRIANENLLVYHRLSWLLVAESTLFSVWAIAFSRGERHGMDQAGPAVLAALGLAVCVVVYAGVFAALRAIDEFKAEYEAKHPTGRPHPRLPRIVGDPRTFRLGRLVPLCLPPLFMAGWVFVLLLTFVWRN
jgi:hypothetical protein